MMFEILLVMGLFLFFIGISILGGLYIIKTKGTFCVICGSKKLYKKDGFCMCKNCNYTWDEDYE